MRSEEPARAPAAGRRIGRARTPAHLLLVSALVLIPCFWQARMQDGLSSHLYNAWLVQLIQAGHAPGLSLASQHTNVLFDLILSVLWRLLGPAAAERFAVAICVLIFFWGAYAFVSALSGRRPRYLLPVLAALSYGWVFHFGIFNFYLSAGLSFWAFALLMEFGFARLLTALALFALAATAHALPVATAAALVAYHHLCRRLGLRGRLILLAVTLAVLAAAARLVALFVPSKWYAVQWLYATGTDQFSPYLSTKYVLLQLLLLLVAVHLLERRIRTRGFVTVLADPVFQLCLLCATAAAFVPTAIHFPAYRMPLNYIAMRMSLWVALCACGLFASVTPGRGGKSVAAVVAALFFVFLYADERVLNRVEDRIQAAVATVPPASRVILPFTGSSSIHPLAQTIDRACIGHCFSYANYEPSSDQFRVRCTEANSMVTCQPGLVFELQAEGHVVTPSEAPLYEISVPPGGADPMVHRLEAGDTTRASVLPSVPSFF